MTTSDSKIFESQLREMRGGLLMLQEKVAEMADNVHPLRISTIFADLIRRERAPGEEGQLPLFNLAEDDNLSLMADNFGIPQKSIPDYAEAALTRLKRVSDMLQEEYDKVDTALKKPDDVTQDTVAGLTLSFQTAALKHAMCTEEVTMLARAQMKKVDHYKNQVMNILGPHLS